MLKITAMALTLLEGDNLEFLARMIQLIRSEAQGSPSQTEGGATSTSQPGRRPVKKVKQA